MGQISWRLFLLLHCLFGAGITVIGAGAAEEALTNEVPVGKGGGGKEAEGDQIVLAQVVFRHGERAPNTVCRTDEFQESAWPAGFEELTDLGVQQQFALGQRLRQRYVHQLGFMSPTYNNKEIYVRSSDVNRTLVSAMANAAGFYTALGGTQPQFTPVPVHSVERWSDFLNARSACRMRQELLIALLKETPEYRAYHQEHKQILDEISAQCGEPVAFFLGDARMNAGMLQGNIEILTLRNYPLPKWITPEIRNALRNLTETEANWRNGIEIGQFRGVDLARELASLRGGPLLSTLVEIMRRKQPCAVQDSGSSECPEWLRDRRLFTYSAHDTSLASLFAALGLRTNADRDGYVPFASALIFELWKRGKTPSGGAENNSNQEGMDDPFYVKVLFWPGHGSQETRPAEIDFSERVEGCQQRLGGGCSLSEFVARSERYRPLAANDPRCTTASDIREKLETDVALLVGGLGGGGGIDDSKVGDGKEGREQLQSFNWIDEFNAAARS